MSATITTICPVCGYEELEALFLKGKPYLDGVICPSCGTEFGYSDLSLAHEELRRQWIASGAKWWSQFTLPPAGWKAMNQLYRAGFLSAVREKEAA